MESFQLRLVGAGLCLLLVFPLGLWLSYSGKPYNGILFNVHKLIGLGMFVFLTINIYRINQVIPLSPIQFTTAAIAGLFFIATIVSGGLVSIDKPMLAFVSLSHRILPYLTAFSTLVSLYLLLRYK